MFRKRKIHKVVKTLFGKEKILSEEEIASLVLKMISGDKSARNTIILSHVRLAVSIALCYGGDDAIGTAMLALMDSIQKVCDGKELTGGIKGYIAMRVHSRCNHHVKDKHVVRVPGPVYAKLFKEGKPIHLPKITTYGNASVLRMDIYSLCETDLEREIISLREQSYTYREVGARVGLSRQGVKNIVDNIGRKLCV